MSPSSPEPSPDVPKVFVWIAVAVLVGVIALVIVSILRSKAQARELDALRTEWAIRHAEFVRLSHARTRVDRVESAVNELEGSWTRDRSLGVLVRDALTPFSERITLGKVQIESAYRLEQMSESDLRILEPHHEVEGIIAGRCYAESPETEILSLLQKVEAATGLRSVSLEGVQRIEGRGDGGDTHTVFALRLGLPPRELSMGVAAP